MKNNKILRKTRIKKKVVSKNISTRVLVQKSLKYDYLQAFDEIKKVTIITSSTKNIEGKTREEKIQKMADNFSKKLKAKKINTIMFDRSGYKYHGRVKLIADALRKNQIKF